LLRKPESNRPADRLGNRTIFKRLGFLLSRIAPSKEGLIKECRKRLSQGYSKLDPALPAKSIVTARKLWVPDNWMRLKTIDRSSSAAKSTEVGATRELPLR
jgi:hypothetical protein